MWPAKRILMIKPASFGYNEETAVTNSFQKIEASNNGDQAKEEFDAMANLLAKHGIDVLIINDTAVPIKPDAVFPNNWFSTHPDGTFILYPMLHHNRRIERRKDIISMIAKQPEKIIDLSELEQQDIFLEGTGSLVIDHDYKIAYAALSPRTSVAALEIFESKTGIKVIPFEAYDRFRKPVYHTNVVMALSPQTAVICLDSIAPQYHTILLNHFGETKKQVLEITIKQMENFAGNMLCLRNDKNQQYLVLSQTALKSLHNNQIETLEQHHQLLPVNIPYIETIGGGSARCMMAELF
jgi:hypothetical protein